MHVGPLTLGSVADGRLRANAVPLRDMPSSSLEPSTATRRPLAFCSFACRAWSVQGARVGCIGEAQNLAISVIEGIPWPRLRGYTPYRTRGRTVPKADLLRRTAHAREEYRSECDDRVSRQETAKAVNVAWWGEPARRMSVRRALFGSLIVMPLSGLSPYPSRV